MKDFDPVSPWQRLTSLSAVFLGSIIAISLFAGGVFLVATAFRQHGLTVQILTIAFLGWILVTESFYVFESIRSLLRPDGPAPVQIAERQPNLPWLLRPVVCLWWVYHFALALVWSILLAMVEPNVGILGTVFLSALTGCFTYVMYSYLLLAVTAFGRNHARVEALWRLRIIWSSTHAVLVIVAGFAAPFIRPN